MHLARGVPCSVTLVVVAVVFTMTMSLWVCPCIGTDVQGLDCNLRDSCLGCTWDGACRWCASLSACIEPREVLPLCRFNAWTHCCPTFVTCDSCVLHSMCGWCDAQGCRSGNSSGPVSATGRVCGTPWRWTACAKDRSWITRVSPIAVAAGVGITVGAAITVGVLGMFLSLLHKRFRQNTALRQLRELQRGPRIFSDGVLVHDEHRVDHGADVRTVGAPRLRLRRTPCVHCAADAELDPTAVCVVCELHLCADCMQESPCAHAKDGRHVAPFPTTMRPDIATEPIGITTTNSSSSSSNTAAATRVASLGHSYTEFSRE